MWGFRRDNWRDSASRVIVFVVSASALMLAAAPLLGHWPISSHVWIVLGAYPVWALAQQFLLCAVLARGLAHWLPARAVPATAGLLFALAHVPDLLLVVLTFVAGMVFVALYQRRPNLWVQALGHAVLGTLAYYAILGRDPVAALLAR
jgi:membrane protease YdiL (CAAX protease family)